MEAKQHDLGYYPKSEDELRFYLKHIIKKLNLSDPTKDDKLFKATNVKTYNRKKDRHGYASREDAKVYESVKTDKSLKTESKIQSLKEKEGVESETVTHPASGRKIHLTRKPGDVQIKVHDAKTGGHVGTIPPHSWDDSVKDTAKDVADGADSKFTRKLNKHLGESVKTESKIQSVKSEDLEEGGVVDKYDRPKMYKPLSPENQKKAEEFRAAIKSGKQKVMSAKETEKRLGRRTPVRGVRKDGVMMHTQGAVEKKLGDMIDLKEICQNLVELRRGE